MQPHAVVQQWIDFANDAAEDVAIAISNIHVALQNRGNSKYPGCVERLATSIQAVIKANEKFDTVELVVFHIFAASWPDPLFVPRLSTIGCKTSGMGMLC